MFKKAGITLLLILLVLIFYFSTKLIHFLDYPYFISEKEEVITVKYMAWACDCAEWTKLEDIEQYTDNQNDELSQRSIFIEAKNENIKLPSQYESIEYTIRLTGSFYINNGISRDYEMKTFEKPKQARVFRYSKFEVIKL